jgi:uncharacterized protein (DUF2147 family)
MLNEIKSRKAGKNFKMLLSVLLITVASQLFAQKNVETLIGKWQTEDNTIVEMFKNGNTISIKQITAAKEKEKINNGKIIGRDFLYSEKMEYKGTVINPENNKEYKALLILAADNKSLKLKVKWGFLSFNETWKKI